MDYTVCFVAGVSAMDNREILKKSFYQILLITVQANKIGTK
jgi:hypothetical protein